MERLGQSSTWKNLCRKGRQVYGWLRPLRKNAAVLGKKRRMDLARIGGGLAEQISGFLGKLGGWEKLTFAHF